MKKLLLLLVFLLFSASCYAQSINLGTFGNNTYLLQAESLRFCSTVECLYVGGQEQQLVAARITVLPSTGAARSSEDVLSYNKTLGFSEKSILVTRDGSRFVLVQTATYDVNGNPIDIKNETEEKKTFVSNEFSANVNKGGAITGGTRDAIDVYVRRIAWSTVFPGTPQESITRAILSYAESNRNEIDASSISYNFIKTE